MPSATALPTSQILAGFRELSRNGDAFDRKRRALTLRLASYKRSICLCNTPHAARIRGIHGYVAKPGNHQKMGRLPSVFRLVAPKTRHPHILKPGRCVEWRFSRCLGMPS